MSITHSLGFLPFGILGIFAMLFQALIVIGIVFLIIYGIRALARRDGPSQEHHHHGQPRHSEKALEVLAERFARGEISVEEYRQMKEELQK